MENTMSVNGREQFLPEANERQAAISTGFSSVDKDAIRKVIINGADLVKLDAQSPDYLIEDLLLREGTSAWVGQPDSLKSMLARQVCIANAAGESDVCGFKLNPKHQRSLFLTTEDSRTNSAFLFKKQVEAINAAAAPRVDFITVEDSLTSEETFYAIQHLLHKHRYDIVVIDAYGDLFTYADGNNNQSQRNTIRIFNKLAMTHHTHFLLVHHISKSGYNASPNQRHAMGGAAIMQKVRTGIQLKPGPGNTHFLTVVKGNATPRHLKNISFELSFDEKTFLLSSTGKTVDVEDLDQSRMQKKDKNSEAKELARQLKSEGHSYTEIEEKLKEMGFHASRGSLFNWTKDVQPVNNTREETE